MKTLLTYLPYLISFFIGYFLIVVLGNLKKRLPFSVHAFLAIGLGLGISAQITFFSFVIFATYHKTFILGSNLIVFFLLAALALIKTKARIKNLINLDNVNAKDLLPYLVLIVFAYPLWNHSHFYVYGGWDAWATWNLKAKMLFLAPDGWERIFDPVLWRSSPHYPLHLPMINCWGWVFHDTPDFIVPVTTAFVFSFSTVGILLAGLLRITKSGYALLCAVFLLSSPMFVKLSLSQYADIVVAYYLLASLFCLVQVKREKTHIYAILCGLLVGFLSFSKGEGLIASAMILFFGIFYLLWKNKPGKKLIITLYVSALLASIVTIVYTCFYAPENQTFINGLTSTTSPVSFYRIKATFSFYLVELVSPTWNGLWIVLIIGLLLSMPKCFSSMSIIFPAFLLGYIGVITAYYYVNTYFDSTRILWWLQVSLHRLMYATLPSVTFWAFYAVWQWPARNGGKEMSQ